MHYLDSNEPHGEKARWKLHKYFFQDLVKTAYAFLKKIMEEILHKIAAVRPLNTPASNKPSK